MAETGKYRNLVNEDPVRPPTQAGYSGQTQSGYPGQTPPGYNEQAQSGYPGQTQSGYPGQVPPGYTEHAQSGYPGQTQSGYSGQALGGYPVQAQSGYPVQAPPGYVYSNPQPNSQQQLVVQTTIVRQTQQAAPSDYMVFAIMVTLFCCLPFGIVGIIKASEAKNRFASGDYEGAEESSKSAKNWSMAGLVTGLAIVFSAVIILVVIIAVGELSSLGESYSNNNDYRYIPVPVESYHY